MSDGPFRENSKSQSTVNYFRGSRYPDNNEQSPKIFVTEKTNLKAPVIPKNNHSPEYNRSSFLKLRTIDIIMSISSLFCPFFS